MGVGAYWTFPIGVMAGFFAPIIYETVDYRTISGDFDPTCSYSPLWTICWVAAGMGYVIGLEDKPDLPAEVTFSFIGVGAAHFTYGWLVLMLAAAMTFFGDVLSWIAGNLALRYLDIWNDWTLCAVERVSLFPLW